jgi:hypothetical protein
MNFSRLNFLPPFHIYEATFHPSRSQRVAVTQVISKKVLKGFHGEKDSLALEKLYLHNDSSAGASSEVPKKKSFLLLIKFIARRAIAIVFHRCDALNYCKTFPSSNFT